MCPSAQSGETCVACGGDGRPCCSGRTCAGKYSLCRPSIDTNGTCTSRCGQVGQDCCSNDFSNESSLACRNGAVCLWQTTVRQTTPTGTICLDPSAWPPHPPPATPPRPRPPPHPPPPSL